MPAFNRITTKLFTSFVAKNRIFARWEPCYTKKNPVDFELKKKLNRHVCDRIQYQSYMEKCLRKIWNVWFK